MEDGFKDFGTGTAEGSTVVASALVLVDRKDDGVLMEFLELLDDSGQRHGRIQCDGLS